MNTASTMKSIKNESEEKLLFAEQKLKDLKKTIQTKDAQIEDLSKSINKITAENTYLQKKLAKALDKIKVKLIITLSLFLRNISQIMRPPS